MMASQSTEICSQAKAHNFVFGKSCFNCETENWSDSFETRNMCSLVTWAAH